VDTVFGCLHFSLTTINVLVWTGPADSLTIPDGFSGLGNSTFSCEISAGKIRRQLPLTASLPGLRLKNRHIPRKYETIKACPNGKCLATKHHQTLSGDQTFYRLATLFGAV